MKSRNKTKMINIRNIYKQCYVVFEDNLTH